MALTARVCDTQIGIVLGNATKTMIMVVVFTIDNVRENE